MMLLVELQKQELQLPQTQKMKRKQNGPSPLFNKKKKATLTEPKIKVISEPLVIPKCKAERAPMPINDKPQIRSEVNVGITTKRNEN